MQQKLEVIYSNVFDPNVKDDSYFYDNNQQFTGPSSSTIIAKPLPKSSVAQFIFIFLLTIAALILGYFCMKPTTGEAATAALKSPIKTSSDTPKSYSYHDHSPHATSSFRSTVTPFNSTTPRT